MTKAKYIFKSERLGFRNWTIGDEDEYGKLNSDTDLMQHFLKSLTENN